MLPGICKTRIKWEMFGILPTEVSGSLIFFISTNSSFSLVIVELSIFFFGLHTVEAWEQVTQLTGDFFAQNTEVVQPGTIAPWYQVWRIYYYIYIIHFCSAFCQQAPVSGALSCFITLVLCDIIHSSIHFSYRHQRYGHTLNALDTDGDGEDDMMILLGGYSPAPSNDIWITVNGTNWM